MQVSWDFPIYLYVFRMLTLNGLKSSWKDDKSSVSIIWGNTEDRILMPSLDLLRDKNYFYFNSARLRILGIKLALCLQIIQLCGTRFLLLCERKLLFYGKMLVEEFVLISCCIYLCLVRPECDQSCSSPARKPCILLEFQFIQWKICFQVYQLFIFTDTWACYFINDEIPGLELSASFLIFILKSYVSF